MNNLKSQRLLGTSQRPLGCLLFPGGGGLGGTHDRPDGPRPGCPGPVRSRRSGTQWTCQTTGGEVQCTGDLSYSWESEPGPDDWCSQPLFSVEGVRAKAGEVLLVRLAKGADRNQASSTSTRPTRWCRPRPPSAEGVATAFG